MVTLKKKKKKVGISLIGKISMIVFFVLLIGAIFRAYQLFGYVFKPNVKQDIELFIPTGSNYNDVLTLIEKADFISNMHAFKWVAKKKKYTENIKPGKYTFKKGMTTNEVVNSLRFGRQTPVDLTFNNIRTFEELAGKVSRYLEPDSVDFAVFFNKNETHEKYSFSKETFVTMFVPNTYEFYWNTSPEHFTERMHTEYERFWNDERSKKADNLKLTRIQVVTLASIVQEETRKKDEKPIVARLYLNRLKIGMPLQADPTIKFSLKNFTARRITNEMLKANSPYNTYLNTGLPPGPINFPETTSVDAVLTPDQHNYLYMCAKEDFSGYHNFATNLAQHSANAAKYHRALNLRKIWN